MILEREYAAGAPWVTSVPSNRHVVAKDLALYSSEFLVAYELKKSQLLAARGRHHPQTLVGISSRHDGDSLEERAWEHSYPRAPGVALQLSAPCKSNSSRLPAPETGIICR